jgi:hypothetical protein
MPKVIFREWEYSNLIQFNKEVRNMDKKSMLYAPIAALLMLMSVVANAADFNCSAFPPAGNAGTVTGFVNGNLLVNTSAPCTVTGSTANINGNIIRSGSGNRTLVVQNGANVNGNIEQFGAGATVTVTGATTRVNGNIYNPTSLRCQSAYVNGNVTDQTNCALVDTLGSDACRVNGSVCGGPSGYCPNGDDDFDDDGIENDMDDDDDNDGIKDGDDNDDDNDGKDDGSDNDDDNDSCDDDNDNDDDDGLNDG